MNSLHHDSIKKRTVVDIADSSKALSCNHLGDNIKSSIIFFHHLHSLYLKIRRPFTFGFATFSTSMMKLAYIRFLLHNCPLRHTQYRSHLARGTILRPVKISLPRGQRLTIITAPEGLRRSSCLEEFLLL